MGDGEGTLIVTGAAGGIRRAIVKHFTDLAYPYTGLFTVRNTSNVNIQPLRNILLKSDKQYSITSLKLSSLTSVRSFAADVNTQISCGALKPIRALALNAGYMSHLGQRFTEDRYERNFQVNYLSNFLLVLALLPSIDRDFGRIVFITSWTHDPTDLRSRLLPLRRTMWRPVRDLAKPSVPDTSYNRSQAGVRRYGESKLWLMMFMHSLQARLKATLKLQNIGVLSVDPGDVFSTGIMREQAWFTQEPF